MLGCSFSPTRVLASWGLKKKQLNSVVFGLRLASSAVIKTEFSSSRLTQMHGSKTWPGWIGLPAELLLIPVGPCSHLLLQDTQRLYRSVSLGMLIVL